MRYSTKIEKEINLLASMLYTHFEDQGCYRKRPINAELLAKQFKTSKSNIHVQLRYLMHSGYISYDKAYESVSAKVKTLKVVDFDGYVDYNQLSRLPKFHPNRIKILSELSSKGVLTSKQIWCNIKDIPRTTVSRIMLELKRLELVKQENAFETRESNWRLI
ncbi:hypothetical protein BC7_00060 [Bacillus phage BC-7]|nr:hypothetical protein BC7_00060 [Bacillus phage BC-7]